MLLGCVCLMNLIPKLFYNIILQGGSLTLMMVFKNRFSVVMHQHICKLISFQLGTCTYLLMPITPGGA